MASRLYADCFVKIFEFLRGDIVSLHAVALVNKSWCQSAISIMWENTLDEKMLMGKNGKQRGFRIIDTYISGLSQASRDALKMEKVILPVVTRLPTFPYASYLRNLDLKCFYIALQSWIEYSVFMRKGLTSDQIRLLIQELLQQIFTLSRRMNVLRVNVDIIGAIVADILQRVPKANKCLAHLKEFMYFAEHPTMETLFSQIAQSAGQIERLDISVYDRTAELINMIRAQRNLKVLIITNRTNSPFGFKFWTNTDAGTVILEKARSITNLEIQKIHFPFQDLARFENLLDLNLLFSGTYGFQDWAPLADVRLKNLRNILYQNRHSLYLDIFGKFVENSGKSLSSITINCCTICDPDKSHLLITSIADNCPNLLHFGGPIGANNASELGQLLNACSHIESLELHPSVDNCRSAASPIDFNPVFRKITLKQPWNLKELSVIHGWKFSAEVLENFIQSRERISKKIRIFWNDCEIMGNFDKICQKYQKNGILDKYGKINTI
ncbi:14960_t:CDS:1, partial [Acaulospora colombiana]